jgi:hypothetical protein
LEVRKIPTRIFAHLGYGQDGQAHIGHLVTNLANSSRHRVDGQNCRYGVLAIYVPKNRQYFRSARTGSDLRGTICRCEVSPSGRRIANSCRFDAFDKLRAGKLTAQAAGLSRLSKSERWGIAWPEYNQLVYICQYSHAWNGFRPGE